MGNSPNPYADFGGGVIQPPAVTVDPYAEFGGGILGAPAPQTKKSATTIGPPIAAPRRDSLEDFRNLPNGTISTGGGEVADALDSIRQEIGNYTQEGRAEHPILSRIGDALNSAHELLVGAGPEKPYGLQTGFLNNPAIMAVTAGIGAPEASAAARANLAEGVEAVKAARIEKAEAEAANVKEVNPQQFIYKEAGSAPQHGTPVKVASPLDNATINNLPGGKDLSPEAIKTLKEHIGGTPGKEIEVGSTAKNTLLKAVEPVQKTIADTGAKMNQLIDEAEPFRTSIADDGQLADIQKLRDNLPGREEERLGKTIDKEIKSADSALQSTDPKEVLAYRRKLGSQIDWNNIVKNPETPGEVQNATKANLYHMLTDKLHVEIPQTADLDKIFQPNLELQSHLDAKLGQSVSRNAAEANAQQASELAKGKRQLETDSYNAAIRKNRQLAGLPDSEVQPSIQPSSQTTAVDNALDRAVSRFKAPASEQGALQDMLRPKVKSGPSLSPLKLAGTDLDWFGALRSFDQLTPAERSARFSNPTAIRQVLARQTATQITKAIVKAGSVGALARQLGLKRSEITAVAGE